MQARPWPLAIVSLAVMIALLVPVFAMRLDSSDAGNDPANTSSRHAFDLLAQGFGHGIQRPAAARRRAAERRQRRRRAERLRAAVERHPGVVAVTQPRIGPSGTVAVIQAYPDSAPQALATTNLVNHLRDDVLPAFERRTGVTVLVGGFTAGSIDFSHVLSSKLPLFFGIVILLSALLLFVIFRSLVIPVQAAIMNLLTIGASLGVTVAGLPGRMVRKRARGAERPDRSVGARAHVRGRVRPLDGLRGVPDLAHPRAVDPQRRRVRRGRATASRSPGG